MRGIVMHACMGGWERESERTRKGERRKEKKGTSFARWPKQASKLLLVYLSLFLLHIPPHHINQVELNKVSTVAVDTCLPTYQSMSCMRKKRERKKQKVDYVM